MFKIKYTIIAFALFLPELALSQNIVMPGTGLSLPSNWDEIVQSQRLEFADAVSSQATVQATGLQSPICNPSAHQFDWRAHAAVTPVKHQGSCGSCWAFAAVSAIETSYLTSLNDADRRRTGIALSTQEALDCAGIFRTTQQDNVPYDCKGGWFEGPFRMATTVGLSATPYRNPDGTVTYIGTQSRCRVPEGNRIYATSWTPLAGVSARQPIATTSTIKDAICRFGGVVSAISTEGWEQNFRGTRIQGATNPVLDPYGIYKYDHAVQIVGWNDAENVWIVKNSWGENWAAGGYVEIPYNSSNIGYSSLAVLANVQRFLRGAPSASSAAFLNIRESIRQTNIKAIIDRGSLLGRSTRELENWGRFLSLDAKSPDG